MTAEPSDPTVAAFVAAINSGDRDAFFATLAEDATMSDDGTARDLSGWVDKEIFSSNGHMEVEEVSSDGRTLTATFTNSTWGGMRTRWTFTVAGDRVSHFATGQA